MILNAKIASLILFLLLLALNESLGQDVRLENPSFEGESKRGVKDIESLLNSNTIDGWYDCGSNQFPKASPPDLASATCGFWEMENREVPDGSTFLVLVTREDDSYESLSQELSSSLEVGKCYILSITLAQSATYLSHTIHNQTTKVNFDKPVVFRLWGGQSHCERQELLLETEPIDHEEWRRYTFQIKPETDLDYITIEAFFKTPILYGYNGNLCIDAMSDFVLIDCKEDSMESIEVLDLKIDDTSMKLGSEILTLSIEQQYLSDLYASARNYGLYRYVRTLSKNGIDSLMTHLDRFTLNHPEWQDAIQLGEDVDSAGYTPESLKKIEYFNSATGWRQPIEAYLIENEIPFDKKE